MGLLSWLLGERQPPRAARDNTASAVEPTSTPQTAGWRELPPIQRTTEGFDLVSDPAGFRGSLDTWRDASVTGRLTHMVAPDAPAGLMHHIASPAPPVTVSREVPSEAREFPVPRSNGTPEQSPMPLVLQRSTADSSLVSVPPSASAPVRRLVTLPPPVPPSVQSSAAHSVQPSSAPNESGMSAVPAPVQRSITSATPPLHHFGLGEPLSQLPPTAHDEPAARTGPSPAHPDTSFDPPVTGSDDAAGTRPLLGDSPPPVHVDAQAAPVRPVADPVPSQDPPVQVTRTVARLQRLTDTVKARPLETPVGGLAGRPLQRPAEDVVPLVAQRSIPLFSGVDTAPVPDRGPVVGHDPAPPTTAVPVRWPVPSGSESPAFLTPEARSAPRSVAQWTVQRAPATAPVPAAAQVGAAAAAGRTRPVQRMPTGRSPQRVTTDAGSVAVASGIAQRAPDGSVVFQPPPGPSTGPPPPGPPTPAVQRDVDAPDPPPETPPDPAPTSVDTGSTGGAVRTTSANEPIRPAESAAPTVTDELVRALFAPLSRLLKAELRLERERSGRLINIRH